MSRSCSAFSLALSDKASPIADTEPPYMMLLLLSFELSLSLALACRRSVSLSLLFVLLLVVVVFFFVVTAEDTSEISSSGIKSGVCARVCV